MEHGARRQPPGVPAGSASAWCVEDGSGEWHEPDDVVIVQGRAGSATLLAFAPGTADAWGRIGARGPEGEVTPLP